ncbi:hypothetical protein [Pseudomonas corrugata]|uniref:hypothetical protein n=1 Tax=Pseudomonas corrugata TaxID=47879 RepID=UPI0015861C90|nr:hypothetical protein [Pseudomonas corrugata]MCI0994894.1 hypothetical protein [Pseudomonas corrugata]NUT65729.1 hypothetical protein [Pseudomonas corrugata]
MDYVQDFEKGQDDWRFTQGPGEIVKEQDGNHYITGGEYVTDYNLFKDFDLQFARDIPVTIKFKIKIPKNVVLIYLSCGFSNNLMPLDIPASDDKWHECETTLPPPPQSEPASFRIWAYNPPEAPPRGVGFDDIAITQQ